MTQEKEKQFIIEQRAMGMSFVQIGKYLGRSADSVRSIFNHSIKRNTKSMPVNNNNQTDSSGDEVPLCRNCGKPFEGKSAKRQFCSDRCRNAWFTAKKRRIPYAQICEQCGKEFTAFGNPNKRFCSRKCFTDSQRNPLPEEHSTEVFND
ncbi:hypothetical protein [Enterocloster clostridioformis]|uniref:hypothetical protein n=1 Tax=Enterocloster clostridioformis TaxID=1531 RepID=UPI0008E12F04|nr:hypothetical protein [Enterocloster clostridioformis]SFG86697.1 hypothetical protein SAMN05660211_04190 [Enterocloster clostridioformis]